MLKFGCGGGGAGGCQFGFDEAFWIGGCVGEIAGIAATGAKSETIERDERHLRFDADRHCIVFRLINLASHHARRSMATSNQGKK
jgi:hypothetical protein